MGERKPAAGGIILKGKIAKGKKHDRQYVIRGFGMFRCLETFVVLIFIQNNCALGITDSEISVPNAHPFAIKDIFLIILTN